MERFWLKSHYFISYAILGAYAPFLSQHASDIGVSNREIGIIFGLAGLSAIVTPPLLTFLADTRFSNRSLLGVCYLLAGICLTGVAFAPNVIVFGACFVLYSITFGGAIPLLDGLTFSNFEQKDLSGKTHQPYHLFRIWGSIGFIAPALLTAGLIYYTKSHRDAVLAAVLIASIGLLTAVKLPTFINERKKLKPKKPTFEAFEILMSRKMRAFVLSMMLMTMGATSLYAFYPKLLSTLGVSKEWLGLAQTLGILVELPFVLYSGYIIQRLGFRNVMIIGAACMVCRYVLLANVPNLGVALATQLLHGPIVLTMYVLPQVFINKKASNQCRNSIQGLYVMLCSGIARMIGSAVGGVFAGIQLEYCFMYSAILGGIAFGILLFTFRDTGEIETIEATTSQTVETNYTEQT